MGRRGTTAILALVFLTTWGCSTKKSKPSEKSGETPLVDTTSKPTLEDPPREVYRAAIILEGGEVPFFIEVDQAGQAALIPGKERFSGTLTSTGQGVGRRINLSMDAGNGQKFEATETAEGRLEGTWSTYGPIVDGVEFPFVADRVESLNWDDMLPLGGEPVDLTGNWDFTFEHLGTGTANFEALGSRYWSRVITKQRDLRAATANATSEGVAIAFFDGYQAWLMKGEWLDGTDTMEGTMYFWNNYTGTFAAKRSDASPDVSFVEESLNKEVKGSTKGASLLADHLGKPVLLEVGGTWCTACTDTLPQVKELAKKFAGKGLVIAAANIEFATPELARKRVADYNKLHDISFPTFALADVEDFAAKFPGLPEPGSLPTFYFIDRSGTLQALYTGYVPKLDATLHAAQSSAFMGIVAELVGSPN